MKLKLLTACKFGVCGMLTEGCTVVEQCRAAAGSV